MNGTPFSRRSESRAWVPGKRQFFGDQDVEDVRGHLCGNVEFPSELADIGDPRCADARIAEIDLP